MAMGYRSFTSIADHAEEKVKMMTKMTKKNLLSISSPLAPKIVNQGSKKLPMTLRGFPIITPICIAGESVP